MQDKLKLLSVAVEMTVSSSLMTAVAQGQARQSRVILTPWRAEIAGNAARTMSIRKFANAPGWHTPQSIPRDTVSAADISGGIC